MSTPQYPPVFRLWTPVTETKPTMPASTQAAGDATSPSTPKPAAACDWDGDKAEPELDDLAYQHAPNEPLPTPQAVPRTPSPEVLPPPLVNHPTVPSAKDSPTEAPIIQEPAPMVDTRLEWHQKHHAEKEKAHDERHKARREEDMIRRELKKKEKSERKARERARRESRRRERHERRSRKSETNEPRKPSIGTRLKEKVESELQVLAGEVKHSFRSILQSSDGPKQPPKEKPLHHWEPVPATSDNPVPPKGKVVHHEEPIPVDPLAHRHEDTFTQEHEIVQAAKNADDTAINLAMSTANDQSKSTQHNIHPDLIGDKYECGHTKDVADGKSSTLSNQGDTAKVPPKSQPAAPGMLERASCLCGALPPNPSEYAADEPGADLTPRIDTPGHQDPFSDPWDKN
ncbi:hypothetical protein E8E14_004847 [Neopestalotiopsis sp. 37M]|nr:hypothetical protein E8E14_004847 [Neopestalotiopsis sp. 37M]